MNTILVTGGTGTLGRALVGELLDRGREVRVLSRNPRPVVGPSPSWAQGDLRRGPGLGHAVAGVDTIVHCATGPVGDLTAAGNLAEAARNAGDPHLIYISIVGVDRIDFGYYRAAGRNRRIVPVRMPGKVMRAFREGGNLAPGNAAGEIGFEDFLAAQELG